MKKPKYRLQSVQEVRERAKDKAAAFVRVRREQLAHEESELARRHEALNKCRQRQAAARMAMDDQSSKGIVAQKLALHQSHLNELRALESEILRLVADQETAVARAQNELEKALDALRAASKELQVIEKHKEGWHQKLQLEEQRREQKTNDEIGAVIYERRR